jgi:hypothetical protein
MYNTPNLNGYQNMGMLLHYANVLAVDWKLMTVFVGIAKYSIGYCRPTTNVPLTVGKPNPTRNQWAKSLRISESKFKRDVATLAELKLVTIHTGSNYRTGGGSYADYYSINFNAELQTKHNIYFNLSGVSSKDSDVYYFIEEGKPLLVNPNSKLLKMYNGSVVLATPEQIATHKESK